MAKLPKEMPSDKKKKLMPEEPDPIFGDEMNLAEDVSEGGDDMDAALDSERLGPAEDMEEADQELIEQFKELLKRKPEALAQVQEDEEKAPEDEGDMEELMA